MAMDAEALGDAAALAQGKSIHKSAGGAPEGVPSNAHLPSGGRSSGSSSKGSSFNWAALVLVTIGGFILVIAWTGTQKRVWNALTGQSTPPDTTPPANPQSTSFNPTNFNYLTSFLNPSIFSGNTPGSNPMANNYRAMAMQDALQAGIDPSAFVRQIQQESGFNPTAKSPAGAEGIAQFMPSTAAGLHIDPWNPAQSLQGAAGLMSSYVKQYGGEAEALAAYNAGPGALQSAKNRGGSNWRMFLPTETQNYIHTILGS